jgi:hypothetical protein
MITYLQQFLLAGNTPSDLLEQYGISHRRHLTYPNLILFKYSQIDSPMGEPIVQQARGIVLDESNNWNIVARGFDKFFNLNEGHAALIDWSTAKVHEKLDGTLTLLYEYNGHWNIATTGSPDASGKVLSTRPLTLVDLLLAIKSPGYFLYRLFTIHLTFKDLFLLVYEAQAGPLPDITEGNINTCFLFELMTPLNRIVIPQGEARLVQLAARDRVTGDYLDIDLPNIPKAKEFPLTNIKEILDSFEHIDGLSQEGFVVSDSLGHRIKVKHPQYVALHHLRDRKDLKWLAKVVITGESPEFLSVFPEYGPPLKDIKDKYLALVKEIEEVYVQTKSIRSQKDFALAIKGKPYSSILFSLRAGKADSVRQWLAEEGHFKSALQLLDID